MAVTVVSAPPQTSPALSLPGTRQEWTSWPLCTDHASSGLELHPVWACFSASTERNRDSVYFQMDQPSKAGVSTQGHDILPPAVIQLATPCLCWSHLPALQESLATRSRETIVPLAQSFKSIAVPFRQSATLGIYNSLAQANLRVPGSS